MSAIRRGRRAWLWLHRVLGLVAGAVFVLLGLTGSALVYYLEIDEWLNPVRRGAPAAAVRTSADASAPATSPSAQAVYEAVRAAHPARTGPWRIEMPRFEDEPVRVRYYNPPERPGHAFRPLMLNIDPGSMKLTSERYWGEYAMTWIYDLHYSLLAGRTGRTAVGAAGLAMLVSLASGVWLWWPSRRRLWQALRPRLRPGRVRSTWDLHVLTGAYGLALTVTLTATGVCLALPEQMRGLLGAFAALHELPAPPKGLSAATLPSAAAPEGAVSVASTGPSVSLDAAVSAARLALPAAEVRWIETSGADGAPITVRMHRAGDPGRRFPQARVWIHPVSGSVIAVHDLRAAGAGDAFWSWIHPLHNGEGLGSIGRAVAFLGGLLPALLLITGTMRWRQRKNAAARVLR